MVAQLFDIFLPPDRRNIIAFSGSMQSLIHQGLIFSFSRCAMTLGLQLLQHYDTLDTPQIAERLGRLRRMNASMRSIFPPPTPSRSADMSMNTA